MGVVDEVHLDLDRVVDDKRGFDACRAGLGSHRDLDFLQPDHVVELRFPFVDAPVPRHDHPDFMLAAFDALRKGARDVRKASGLGERFDLA